MPENGLFHCYYLAWELDSVKAKSANLLAVPLGNLTGLFRLVLKKHVKI